ncbi:MAG: diguanylate cyclase, partial [Nitrospira sp.]|nr:diguanylate cyclase [Nitrospira sp.]
YVLNTGLTSVVIALTDAKPFGMVWKESYLWSFPYYFLGAAVAGLMSIVNRYVGWQTALLVIPVVYLTYRSYGLYLGKLEDERLQSEEMASLHLRTIEALALAIEAKDHTTHDHLERVQLYAVEIGREMGLASGDLEALRAASLLHDIGKLAVPEHIVSKPGQLTQEEFEKMKIHPAVGAEILDRVEFPYPVAPIVKAHHERWDGGGFPEGLAGEAIPLGARILAAVDHFDSLASGHQFRRGLPVAKAIEETRKEAGTALDPAVVEILVRRYPELERKAHARQEKSQLSTDLKITRGDAPAAGFEQSDPAHDDTGRSVDFLESIAAARQEVQALFELAQDLGNSLSLDETLSVLAARLRRMIPCDAIAIYVRRDNVLAPEYVTGEDFRLFSSLEIPMGQGLSGWVAENRKPIINGNPSVEPGYLNDPAKFSKLRSALAVPLEGLGGLLGVLALYQNERDAFTKDHLRILLAISSKVALSIENALRYRQAEDSATVDYLTSLPNARALFQHLDAELARARRTGQQVAVLVSDLDGFKQVNDRFGHLEGNKLLRAVARGLKEACREYDFVARMGGDEFVMILPGITGEPLEARCAKLRAIAVQAGVEICGSEMLGMSIGAAIYPVMGTDAEALLAEADRRMYQQKSENKQRIAAASVAWQAPAPVSIQ